LKTTSKYLGLVDFLNNSLVIRKNYNTILVKTLDFA